MDRTDGGSVRNILIAAAAHPRRYSLFAAIYVAILFLAGCATAPDKATAEKERQEYASRKVAVFCTAPDNIAEDLAEAQIVEALRKKGIDAYAKRVLLPDPPTEGMHKALKSKGVGYVFNFRCMGTEQIRTGLPKGCETSTLEPIFYPDDNGLVLSPFPQFIKVVNEISGKRLP